MPMFNYTARDADGKIRSEVLEAFNEQAVVERLQAQGLFIIKVVPMSDKPKDQGPTTRSAVIKFSHNTVKLEDLLIFSRQLATMLEAGVALLRSLDVCISQIRSKKFFEIVKQVRTDVEAGKALSESLGKHPKVFSQFWVSIVEVGEASGTMPLVLNKLANHVEEENAFRNAITSAVIYPLILCFVSVGAVMFFALFVAPKFEEIFTAMHTELPVMTRALLATFKFIKLNFFYILGGIVGLVFILKSYFKTPVGELQFEKIIFGLPIIGDVSKLIIMERFASQMSILVSSGVPIILALEIVQKLVENQTAGYLIARVREEVSGGKGLAVSMVKESFFPILAVQMIQVGEETGELSKMFDHVAKYYKGNVETIMKRFGTIFEPFMLVFMAGVIGIIVVSIFLPLFKLGQGGGYQH